MFRRRLIKLLASTPLLSACIGPPKQVQENYSLPLRKIAFGSCAADWLEQPVWSSINDIEPDLYISVGDAIYADYDGSKLIPVTPESLRAKWRTLAEKEEFSELRKRVPILATWDNHDYGAFDQGKEFILKEASKEIFLNFWNEPAGSTRRTRPGIYDAYVYGPPGRRVQIILLDTRTFKSPAKPDSRSEEQKAALNIIGRYAPNHDPSVTLLGAAQWDWLSSQLKRPAEIRLIVSSTQFTADEKGMDEWGNYPLEKQKMLTLLQSTRANGVLFLSGNVHFSEISEQPDFPYPLYDFTSSGMTPANINPRYAAAKNSKRIAGPYVDVNFGLVSTLWAADGGAEIILSAHGADGHEVFKHVANTNAMTFTN